MQKKPVGKLIEGKRKLGGMSLHALGVKVGVTGTTIQKWEVGELTPKKSRHLEALSAALDIDIALLKEYRAETYEETDGAIAVVDGRPDLPLSTPKNQMPRRTSRNKERAAPPAGDAQRINIEEAMGKTYKVLTSETPYAVALYLNVQQFSNAVDATKELSTCQDRITNLETQVGALRNQVDRLTAPPITSEQQEDSLAKEAM